MRYKEIIMGVIMSMIAPICFCQVKWVKVDSLFAPLPPSVHVYKTTDSIDGKPNIAYYAEALLSDKQLNFSTDTTYKRRLTPSQFYEKNNHPLIVVNGTFFSFQTSQNLNLVIKDGKIVSHGVHLFPGKGKDTLLYNYVLTSAIGISKKRTADIAWLYSNAEYTKKPYPVAFEKAPVYFKDSINYNSIYRFAPFLRHSPTFKKRRGVIEKWKMQTAIGGGPVLIQTGEIKITNNEELKFAGKALYDKHPRTAMGYTKDGRLIILVVQGRFSGVAEGVNLQQEARLLKDIGCWEALNLDGGGSSCMLINGKSTIQVSDKEGQRAVPAVFIVRN
jgi:hypothetical protein